MQMSNVVIVQKTPRVTVKTLAKGKDGSTWYAGAPNSVQSCVTGDFCFDPETFNVYKCTNGGTPQFAQWELICNLNNLNKIMEFINTYQNDLEMLIGNFRHQADLIKQDVLNTLDKISNSSAYKPWWFGTREEYNAMSQSEINKYELFFVEEGS